MPLLKRSWKILLKKYASVLIYVLLLAAILTIFYISRSNGYFSPHELIIWNTSYLMNNSEGVYSYLLSYSPVLILNILNLYRFLFFNVTIITPFFVGLLFFILFIFNSRSMRIGGAFSIRKSLLFTVFIFNPYVINILCNDLLGLFIAISMLMIVDGVRLYNQQKSPRGIFLVASGLTFLVLNGEVGIAYAITFFSFVPFLIDNNLLKERTLGGYLLLFFPAVAAIISLIYLSWLNQQELELLIFSKRSATTNLSELWVWVMFLPLFILNIIWNKTINLKSIFRNNFGIFFSFIAHLILILLDRSFFLETLIGLVAMSLLLSSLRRNTVSKRDFFVAFYLLVFALFYFGIGKNTQIKDFLSSVRFDKNISSSMLSKGHDQELQTWLLNQNMEKTIVLSGEYSKVTSYLNDFELIVTPKVSNYHLELDYLLENYERIIVSMPELEDRKGTYSKLQKELFYQGTPGLFTTFHNKKWKVFDRKGLSLLNISRPEIISERFRDIFVKDLLYLILLFDLLYLGWNFVYYLKRKVRVA